MKFGKSLSNQIEETLPEWRDKFLSYKELKKRLKLVEPKGGERPSKRPRIDAAGSCYVEDGEKDDFSSSEEMNFIKLLEDELEKFNSFFVEKEEEYIIRLKRDEIELDLGFCCSFRLQLVKLICDSILEFDLAELQDRVGKAMDSNEEMVKIRKEIVDFHGEMVLLENYSALNFTGLVKILKKYDKRTGALIRLPYSRKVLQQPFFTTDLLYSLVKQCEMMLDLLFPLNELPSTGSNGVDEVDAPTKPGTTNIDDLLKATKELSEIEYMESLYMKSTVSALRVLKEIRSRSSTVSVFSLPPLQMNGLEDTWKNVPVLEEVAK
uniref:SPX domain-containing protein n=1 Tax=Cucumis melo TaxID=3656 RepID=A0A9I9CJF0_CUCME